NLDFDKFRPELLKTRIARITPGSHTEGFLTYSNCNYDKNSNGESKKASEKNCELLPKATLKSPTLKLGFGMHHGYGQTQLAQVSSVTSMLEHS
ncbi:MAG: hypothetical protein MJE68_19065, partial [Proteobacteria bacterium]|nr:hypothetical protein [Pseudomonadota bacterium]